jgi:LAO/AO transport system kinase
VSKHHSDLPPAGVREPAEKALSISKGVEKPAHLNEEAARAFVKRRRARRPAREYVDGILAGDRTILAQSITLLESTLPRDRRLAEEILEAVLPSSGKSVRVGITGVPGVGKSTFIEALGTYLTETLGEKLAVLAIDPSSTLTGGSILGDKTRMARLGTNPMAFILPSPSRGSLGGVAQRTRETIVLCEAAGFSNVFVETVGVGQSETLVADMVDFFLLLMLAGAGDELQGIKRGIIEMADLMAINKAEGDNKIRAQMARAEYESALHLFPPTSSGWFPRVVTCSAVENTGVAEIWEVVREYAATTLANGYFARQRREQEQRWMFQLIEEGLRERFLADPQVGERLPEMQRAVAEGRMTSFRAAKELLGAVHPPHTND